MKRSGDVTAAAIVLFFGSALMILMAVVMIVGAAVTPLPSEQRAMQFVLPIFYALLAAWGIATGVGVLQLRPWARISIIVMSSTAVFFAVCGALGVMMVPLLLQQDPNIPAGATRIVVFIGLIVLGVPLAIAIWWLILFTRRRVQLEFATHGATAISSPPLGATIAPEPAPAFATAFAAASSAPDIPISIRVIAIIILVTAPVALFSLPLAIRAHLPTILLGIWMTGWTAPAYLVISVVIQIVLPIAVLRRRLRALDGLIAYLLFATLNALLFFVSSSRNAFFDAITRAESTTSGMDPEMMGRFMKMAMPIVMGFSVLLFALALYFLFTRRQAYRAACEARRAAA
ncbi:MAG TPA: hypothetical protein VGR94_04025 [Candidatus Acidoferrales bacterium]|nr:hypothetical protein [Candidatus Acidoferrales bacterium]